MAKTGTTWGVNKKKTTRVRKCGKGGSDMVRGNTWGQGMGGFLYRGFPHGAQEGKTL